MAMNMDSVGMSVETLAYDAESIGVYEIRQSGDRTDFVLREPIKRHPPAILQAKVLPMVKLYPADRYAIFFVASGTHPTTSSFPYLVNLSRPDEPATIAASMTFKIPDSEEGILKIVRDWASKNDDACIGSFLVEVPPDSPLGKALGLGNPCEDFSNLLRDLLTDRGSVDYPSDPCFPARQYAYHRLSELEAAVSKPEGFKPECGDGGVTHLISWAWPFLANYQDP